MVLIKVQLVGFEEMGVCPAPLEWGSETCSPLRGVRSGPTHPMRSVPCTPSFSSVWLTGWLLKGRHPVPGCEFPVAAVLGQVCSRPLLWEALCLLDTGHKVHSESCLQGFTLNTWNKDFNKFYLNCQVKFLKHLPLNF